MQAIEVKYLPCTNIKGSRFKATCFGGSVTVPYDHSLSADANRLAAANALMAKMKWHNELAEGTLPNGNAVFVLLDRGI